MEAYMKNLNLPIYNNYNIFLFKDEYYNYLLRGNKLCLCPLGHRKSREYVLTDSELSQLVDYYVLPLKKLRNDFPYLVDIEDRILDIEDDMVAFLDSLIK